MALGSDDKLGNLFEDSQDSATCLQGYRPNFKGCTYYGL